MLSVKALVIFGFVAVVCADEKLTEEQQKAIKILEDCKGEHKLEDKDFENKEKFLKSPPEKILCFMKCVAENDGSLDKNGKILPESMEKYANLTKMKEDDKKKIKDCTLALPPIKTCGDMKGVADCISNISM